MTKKQAFHNEAGVILLHQHSGLNKDYWRLRKLSENREHTLHMSRLACLGSDERQEMRANLGMMGIKGAGGIGH